MAVNYTITLTDNQAAALAVVTGDSQRWIENAAKTRAKSALDSILKDEILRLVEADLPIPNNKAGILQSAADYKASLPPVVIPGPIVIGS